MWKKQIFLVAFFLSTFFTNSLFSQSTHTTIKSKGKIPEEIISFTFERVKRDRATINKQTSRLERKAANKFHLQNNYFMDRLMRSGAILFGDELSSYVQKVGDYVISQNPDFNKNIRFYVVKSTEVNAFATYNGMIFINIGLLAKIENEAQLAFILSHELIHYYSKHTLNRYTEEFRLETEYDSYGNMGFSEKVNTYVKYSQSQENTADIEGITRLYSKTNYNINEALTVFEILKYSEYPYLDIPFDLNFLIKDTTYKIPDWYNEFETTEIEAKDNTNDSESLHPNIKSRTKNLNYLLEINKYQGKELYIVSEEEFKKVQKLARYELCELFIQGGMYGEALYYTYLIQQDNPKDEYLKNLTAYALYGIAKYTRKDKLSLVLKSSNEFQGEIQRMHYYLNKISEEQMLKLSIRVVYMHYSIYHNNFIKSLYIDLVNDYITLTKQNIEVPSNIYDNQSDSIKFKDINKEVNLKLENKNDNEKETNNYKKSSKEESYSDIWHDLKSDTAFVNNFNRQYKDYLSKKDTNISDETHSKTTHLNKLITDSILVFNPFYYRTVYNKKYNLIKNEKKEDYYLKALLKNAELSGLGVEIMDMKVLNEDDVSKFNENETLNNWVNEYFRIASNFNIKIKDSIALIPFQQAYLDNILAKYNTRYVALTGIISSTGFRPSMSTRIALWSMASLFYLPLPYALYDVLSPYNETMIIFYLIDTEKRKIVYNDTKILRGRDNKSILNSHIYNTYNELKKLSN
ncbi:MAG: M48 family metallopeptidase [Saprospiraceae bacterium]|nr:M48 family metallopeptidase [Saprospiraceae bacterium]